MSSTKPTTEVSTSSDSKNEGSIYFWREYGSEHCFLSQWYRSDFTTDDDKNIVYKNAEQYMMYHKALLFSDHTTAANILIETDPKAIKALGRVVAPFVQETWLENRERIVGEASYFKFKNGKAVVEIERDEVWKVDDLRKVLLETGKRELVEASPFDKIWGVGFGPDKAEKNRGKWGLNLLGKALMEARGRLRDEQKGDEGQTVEKKE